MPTVPNTLTDGTVIRATPLNQNFATFAECVDKGGDVMTGTLTVPVLKLLDTDAAQELALVVGSNFTADRTLTLTTGDLDREITVTGNPTLTGGTMARIGSNEVIAGNWTFNGEGFFKNGITGSNIVSTEAMVLGADAKANSATAKLQFQSNNASDQLQGSVGFVTSATAALRRLVIEIIEQNVGYRNVTLCENGGNVGVGTTSPTSLLQLQTTTADGHLYIGSVAPSIKLGNNAVTASATFQNFHGLATANGNFGLMAGDAVWAQVGNARGDMHISPNYSGTGTKILVVQSAALFTSAVSERNRAFAIGATQSPVFSGGRFVGVGGTWTVGSGDQTTYNYSLVGDRMTFVVSLATTTVSGSPVGLSIAIPAGYTIVGNTSVPCVYNDAFAGNAVGYANAADGATSVTISKLSGAAFADSTNQTYVDVNITFTVSG